MREELWIEQIHELMLYLIEITKVYDDYDRERKERDMPKFGVSTYSICRKIISKQITPEEGIAWLAAQGAEVIELVPFGIDFLGDPGLIDRVLQAAKKAGVLIDNYSVGANFLMISSEEYEQEIEMAKRQIDVAAKLHVSTIRIDCSRFDRLPECNTVEVFQKDLPVIVNAYRTLCDYANPLQVKVLLENHGFHANGNERVRQIVLGVEREGFGHQLDVGNYICVDDIPEIAVQKMVGFASVIHMKDFYVRSADRNPGDAEGFDCSGGWFRSANGRYLRGSILGQGDLDLYAIMRIIKNTEYDGNLFVEYEGMEDSLYGTKVSLDNMKRIYKEA